MASTKPKTAALQKPAAKASTSVAVRKPNAGGVTSIKEALMTQAAGIKERIAPAAGNKIVLSKKDGFVLPDGTKTPGPLELVVVDFLTYHAFYETNYDPNNITPPGCFAIGTDPRNMTPSANSPNAQSDSCQGCPMNEFGSSGNGKACGNTRLLAVLPPDATADIPLWKLAVSPTALKGFDGYVANVARVFGVPPVGVVTTVSLNENTEYPQLLFSNPQENPNLEVHFARQGEAREMLMTEPDVSAYQPPAQRGRAAPAKKAARR